MKTTTLLFPLLLVFYEIATYLSNDMYLPALPQMMNELGLSTAHAQLTLTVWFLGQASMPLLMGILSDRYGRRPVLLYGGIIYVVGSLICALANNNAVLLLGRFIEGSMVASMLVAGYACIHELFEQKEAIKVLAIMGSISILAPGLGPLFGSLVLFFANWRGIFWIISLWASVAILLLYHWMPETLPSSKRQIIPMTLLLQQYARVLTNKYFMLQMFILGFIFSGWIVWISAGPLLIIENFHYSAVGFGCIQAGIFSAYIAGNYWVKKWVDVFGVREIIWAGLLICLLGGLLAWLLVILFPQYLSLLIISMLFYSFGSALAFAPLNRIIIEASSEPMGIRVAMFVVFLAAFAALGSGIGSLFFDGTMLSLAAPMALCIMVACLMFWLLKPAKQLSEPVT